MSVGALFTLISAFSLSAQCDCTVKCGTRVGTPVVGHTFGVTLAEDLKLFNPFDYSEDRNYTGGIAVTLPHCTYIAQPSRWALGQLERAIFWRLSGNVDALFDFNAENASLALTAFTPDDISRSDIIRGDRPYASTLLVTSRRTRVTRDHRTAITTEFAAGMLGLHLARNAQRFIHKIARRNETKPSPVDPKGWSNQISDDAEPTALATVGVEHVFGQGTWRGRRLVEITLRGVANAGYYTDAIGGLNLRLGRISSGFYAFLPSALNNTEAVTRVANSSIAPATIVSVPPTTRTWEFVVFAQGRGRASLYNALLQGQFLPTAYRVGAYRRLTAEWDTGISAMFPVRSSDVRLTWAARSGRTSELLGAYSRTHTWGSYALGVSRPMPLP